MQKATRRFRVKSYAILPLMVGEDVLGTLYLNFCETVLFSRKIQELLQLFGQQATIAIENARLYEQSASKIRQLEVLSRHL